MNIIIDSQNNVRGYTEDSDFDLNSIEGGINCTLIPIGEPEFEQLLSDLLTMQMTWNGTQFVESSDIEYLKQKKLQAARLFAESIDKFILNTIEYRIDKLGLRNLFTDLMILKEDLAINGLGSCSEPFNGAEYIFGLNGNINTTEAMQVCTTVRCYKRVCDNNLAAIVQGIMDCETSLDVQNFDITQNYPSVPIISGS